MLLITILTTITVIVTVFCIIYLVFLYRKLVDKYSELNIKTDRSEVRKHLENHANLFVSQKIDDAMAKAIEDANRLIAKNANEVAKTIRKKTLEKLTDEEKGEESAVAAEFERAKAEIEKYKEEKVNEIRQKTTKILSEVASEVLLKSLTEKDKENLIQKAIENAKRSNLF